MHHVALAYRLMALRNREEARGARNVESRLGKYGLHYAGQISDTNHISWERCEADICNIRLRKTPQNNSSCV